MKTISVTLLMVITSLVVDLRGPEKATQALLQEFGVAMARPCPNGDRFPMCVRDHGNWPSMCNELAVFATCCCQ